VAEEEDPQLAEFVEWAEGQLEEVRERIVEQNRQADELFQAARQAVENEQSYGEAVRLLEQIPDQVRSRVASRLLEQSRDRQREVQSLGNEIRERVSSKKYDGLLAKVERLLVLKPNHEGATKLAAQLRKRESSPAPQTAENGGSAAKVSEITSGVRTPAASRGDVGGSDSVSGNSNGGSGSVRTSRAASPEKSSDPSALREAVLTHCRKYNSNGYYLTPSIPPSKLENARAAYQIPASSTMLALIDCTVFGSAKEGISVCDDGLYWRSGSSSPSQISWNDFSQAQISNKGLWEVSLAPFGQMSLAGSGCGRAWASGFLGELQTVVRRHVIRHNDLKTEAPRFPPGEPTWDFLRSFCRGYTARDYYAWNAVPPDKLANARQSYHVPDEDDVAALLNCTVFGSAKDGLAVCTSGLYWHNQTEPAKHLPWPKFSKVEIRTRGFFQIELGPDHIFNVAGSGFGRKWALEFLKELQSAIAAGGK